ncbi:hypothetical protein FCL58_00085 [Mycoplasma bovis]|nr:hypothetical protein [Mycoplasmopsis bovis]
MKSKKMLLILKAVSPAISAPVALVSVSGKENLNKRFEEGTNSTSGANDKNGKGANNGTGSNSNGGNANRSSESSYTSGKPGKGVSPQFSSFKDKADEAIKQALNDAVDKIIKYTESELSKIGDLTKPQEQKEGDKDKDKDSYLDKLEKKVYLKELNKLFKDKKNNLKEFKDYAELGLPVTFPFVIANDKEYDTGTINFNGKEYKDIKIGKNENRDYSKVIESNGKDRINKSGKEENIASGPQFESALNKYTQELNKSILDMVYNPKEIPKFGKDIFLEEAKFDQKEGFTVKHPQNSNSWSDYIVKKIKPKFVDFDLKQNQEFKVIDETQPSPKVNPPNLPDLTKKPLVPGKPPTNNDTVNPLEQSETLLSLAPYANYKYSQNSNDVLANLLRNNSGEQKEKIFFFNNPINTRFKYTVENINGNTATVKITDTAKQNVSRTYNCNKNSYISDPRHMFLFQKQSEALSAKFTQLYKALMLDEKIDYSNLAHNELQLSLYGMVNTATKIITDKKFTDLWNSIIIKYANKISAPKSDDDFKSAVKSSSQVVIDKLIQALSASELNNQPFWSSLVNALTVVESDLKEIANHKETREKIINKFKTLKLDFKVLDNTFTLLNKSLLKLRASANNWAKSFQYSKWFDEYTSNVADVRENIEFLRDFLDPVAPNGAESKEFKKLDDSYQKAINKIKNSNRSIKKTYYAIGGTLAAIGLILLLTNVLIFTIKYKNKLNKAIKSAFGISISVSAIVALVGIILILLGLKG